MVLSNQRQLLIVRAWKTISGKAFVLKKEQTWKIPSKNANAGISLPSDAKSVGENTYTDGGRYLNGQGELNEEKEKTECIKKF